MFFKTKKIIGKFDLINEYKTNKKELRILPRNQCFYGEFVYKKESATRFYVNPQNALAIDPGINNWLTGISNVGTSFIVDGHKVKSLNQWYNKRVATIKEGKPQGYWDGQLAHITEKRNRQMRDAGNKAAPASFPGGSLQEAIAAGG